MRMVPILTDAELITLMRDRHGVGFRIMNEAEAESYVRREGNWLRITSYMSNFPRYEKGRNKGRFINLEFAHLVELSDIDDTLRKIMLEMSMEIEHFLKVRILDEIKMKGFGDGYRIVNLFIARNSTVLTKIENMITSTSSGDLIREYFTISQVRNPNTGKMENRIVDYALCPVWVFFELITFGDLIRFYEFYQNSYPSEIRITRATLNLVKSVRNVTAHNISILQNMSDETGGIPAELAEAVSRVIVGKGRKKLGKRINLEFASMLYAYSAIVSSNLQRQSVMDLCSLFMVRMVRHRDYFLPNPLITSCYEFSCRLIIGFFLRNIDGK